jgi:hypothetical protein
LAGQLDLTDRVKGHSQYWIRFGAGASQLRGSGLEIRTVCQANVAVLPRLKDGGTTVSYQAGGTRVASFGPETKLAQGFVTEGGLGEPALTLDLLPARPVVALFAAAHVASGSPPRGDVRYQIRYSPDSAQDWRPMVADWRVPRRGDEPTDFWSQSFCYGHTPLNHPAGQPLQVRFENDGGKRYLRAEAHLVTRVGPADPLRVTYQWSDSEGEHRQSHVFSEAGTWRLDTADQVRTDWVEMQPVRSP